MITFFLSLLKGNSKFFFFFKSSIMLLFLYFPIFPLPFILYSYSSPCNPPPGSSLDCDITQTLSKLFMAFSLSVFCALKNILNGLSLVIHGILNHILFELYPLHVFTHHADCGSDLGPDPI